MSYVRNYIHRPARSARHFLVIAGTVAVLGGMLPIIVHALAGDLDPAFGSGGMVTTDFAGFFDGAAAMAVQRDGKIIAVGSRLAVSFSTPSSDSTRDFALARYNPDGSLDGGFGTAGLVATDFVGFSDAGRGIALQPNGKIVVVGASFTGTSPLTSNFALARYNTDGSLDVSFGSGGKVALDFAGLGVFDAAAAVAVQPNGKIVVAGERRTTSSPVAGSFSGDFGVARFNPDGSLDASFGSGGMVTTDFFGFRDVAVAMALQPDRKIVVVGESAPTPSLLDGDFSLARYNPDGSLDASFGTGGKVTTDFVGFQDGARAVALQPNGRIVVAGLMRTGFTADFADFAVLRYNADGTLDTSFGIAGMVTTDFAGFLDGASAVAVQLDGTIVAAGERFTQSSSLGSTTGDFALARYSPDGSLDTSFGIAGMVTTDFAGFRDAAFAVALRPDGDIVAVGLTLTSASVDSADFALVRYVGR